MVVLVPSLMGYLCSFFQARKEHLAVVLPVRCC